MNAPATAGRQFVERLDRIASAINDAGTNGLSRFEIHALHHRQIPKRALDDIISALLATGDYEEYTRGTGGRPATCYRRRLVPDSRWLTIDGICAELKIDPAEWHEWQARGETPLHVHLPNGEIRVRRTDLNNWYDSLTDDGTDPEDANL